MRRKGNANSSWTFNRVTMDGIDGKFEELTTLLHRHINTVLFSATSKLTPGPAIKGDMGVPGASGSPGASGASGTPGAPGAPGSNDSIVVLYQENVFTKKNSFLKELNVGIVTRKTSMAVDFILDYSKNNTFFIPTDVIITKDFELTIMNVPTDLTNVYELSVFFEQIGHTFIASTVVVKIQKIVYCIAVFLFPAHLMLLLMVHRISCIRRIVLYP
jgi:hypothetical protein